MSRRAADWILGPKDRHPLSLYEGTLHPCDFIKFFITAMNTLQIEQQRGSTE